MAAADVIHQISISRNEKMRSPAEIIAKYNQGCQKYLTLKNSENSNREHLQMIYAEVKTLGWVLGRDEKKIIAEINGMVKK
ncbi:MAG: hypothetical protein MR853_03110 [Selenomonadales bacterium]|nr:hypothetical protein [Selenomonadales bacterium]MDD6218538.1 hypothetical protein [Selenomonadaceae bacterium]